MSPLPGQTGVVGLHHQREFPHHRDLSARRDVHVIEMGLDVIIKHGKPIQRSASPGEALID